MNICKCILFISFSIVSTIQLFAQQDQDTTTNLASLQKQMDRLQKSVKKLENIKITGYFQAQYLYGEKDATLRLGAPNENPDESFSRIGIRRSRVKVTYEEGISSAVFQIDLSERGIIVRDAYLKFKDPWRKTSYLQTGIFFRPFGHDVRYSSSRREAPERSQVVLKLFPAERDLGAMVSLNSAQTSPLNFMTLELALIAGNGVAPETDSKRDFIGHIMAAPKLMKGLNLNMGISYYGGSVYQGTENVFRIQDGGFVANTSASNNGEYARREYIGFDLQTSFSTQVGRTQIRSEYMYGQQPGSISSSMSPNTGRRPDYDTYLRNFQGGYVICIQDLPKLPFAGVFRYDWYDPNTKLAGDIIGLNGTNETDIYRKAFGLGAIWRASRSTELQAYYEINRNEKTPYVSGFESDRKDNIFTMTLLLKY